MSFKLIDPLDRRSICLALPLVAAACLSCSPLAPSMSKYTTQPRLTDPESRQESAPAFLALVTRVLPSAEQQAAESGSNRRSSLRRASEDVLSATDAAPETDATFEYVQTLGTAELREMREDERAVARLTLPRLGAYESAEVLVQLDLSTEQIRATGLDRLVLTLTVAPDVDGTYRLAPASEMESSLIELLQAKLRRVTVILRRTSSDSADAANDPTAYGPHPRAVRISRLTLSAVGRMAVVPVF
jgi:hypothetical protein